VLQVAEHFRQALAFDELHGVEVDAAFLAHGVHVHDVRVVQRGGGAGLVFEPLQVTRIEHRGERQDLEGDAAAQRELLGLVDHAHAAAADLADQAEVAEFAETEGVGPLGFPGVIVARAQAGHHAGGGQQLAECGGVIGVTADELVDVRFDAALEQGDELFDDGVEDGIWRGRVSGVVHG
jgi:hypothetical protein